MPAARDEIESGLIDLTAYSRGSRARLDGTVLGDALDRVTREKAENSLVVAGFDNRI